MIASEIALDGFVHGQNLHNKVTQTGDVELKKAFREYREFRKNTSNIKILTPSEIRTFLKQFNGYREKVIGIFEQRKNSGQENLRSTMLEEFFTHLFIGLVSEICKKRPENLYLGKGSGYVDLTFSPKSFKSMFDTPNPYVHSKDQDFLLGAKFVVSVSPATSKVKRNKEENIVVPVVAIECKTYLERNMLDSCCGTAARIKRAMPYCLYIIASEYLKLKVAQPELTDIDEIFILCKASNSERLERIRSKQPVHPIHSDLIIALFEMVHKHLNRSWWKPEDALRIGKVINRPL